MEYVNLSIMPRKLLVLMVMAAGCSLNPIDAMALNAVQITQQANSVKGRILDPTGEPIIGATVKVNSISRIDRLLIISSNGFNESGITKIDRKSTRLNSSHL